MSEQQQAEQKFDLGMRVVIDGLTGKPELNGQSGLVRGAEKDGRVPVDVGGTIFALRTSNLRPAEYPTELLLQVHGADGALAKVLYEPDRKELQKHLKKLPLILDDAVRRSPGAPCCVAASEFKAQFSMFTAGLFDDWDAEAWSNILVAGGSVLASLTPIPANFDRLRPLSGAGWLEYDLYGSRRRQYDVSVEPKRTRAQYMSQTMCPDADIDLFVHGLSAEAAQAKMLSLFTRLRRTILRAVGVENDVYFIKTPNTVTIGCGKRYRNVQIITRLYGSVEHILNGFDIDCCCVGWDGATVRATPRAAAAIRTKINTIDLQIRGECYESRLLKYVERGYAIGVQHLERAKVDREHIAFEQAIGWRDEPELTSNGWRKWGSADGLAKLLLAEALGRMQGGVIEYAFPGRRRREKRNENDVMHFRLKPYPTLHDGYGSSFGGGTDKAGNPVWPATTHLVALERGEGPFKVEWKAGNMPRKPKLWTEWSAAAYQGAKREPVYDWRKMQREREERERKQKEEEAARREKELESARKEGLEKAKQAIDEAKSEAKQARTEAGKIKKQAAVLATEHESLRVAREIEAREAQERLQRALAEANEKAGEERLCTVCLDAQRSVLFEPCGHLCLCKTCADQVDLCPFCRTKPTRRLSAFL